MTTTLHFTLADDTDGTAPILTAVNSDATTWNGYAVPHVTAEAMAAYVAHWRAVDPNGTWGRVYVDQSTYALVVTRSDSDDVDDWDAWPVAYTVDGERVYAVDGWVWVPADVDA